MKQNLKLMLVVGLLGLILPPSVMAAKSDGKKAKLIAKYDKNANGTIDGDEMAALRKDFAADEKGELKTYDKNGDGKLTDEEISAIKPGAANKPTTEAAGKKSKKATPEKEGDSKDSSPAKKESAAKESTEQSTPKKSE